MEDRAERLSQLLNDLTTWVIIEILVVSVLAWAVIKLTSRTLPIIAELLPARFRQSILNTIPIVRVLVLITLIVYVTPLLFNITFQNFILIAGALSVAIGFAFKDLASAVIAGLIALFEKPYSLGDWVGVGDHYGEVIAIGMRSFQMRTADDDVITVPHDRIWSDNISNANSGTGDLMCVAKFYVERDQDLQAVTGLLRDVAATSAYLNMDNKITVVSENTPLGVTYKLKAYPYEPRDQFMFITDLTERGNTALRAANIETSRVPTGLAELT